MDGTRTPAGRRPMAATPRRRTPAKKAAWTAVTAAVLGGALHVYGLSYVLFLQPQDSCWFKAGRLITPDSRSELPVSLVCGGEEIVPVWLNPALLLLAVTAVGSAVAAVVWGLTARRRGARAPSA
ncbi:MULTISPECIES: hypothetical protein [unclassified Streptomyces]|uniref:hypothetical protein n=1 Tax=unclassified Streptomyces TaxID=2593676 RepID=UPI0004C40835